MKKILVTMDKSAEDFVTDAKKILEQQDSIEIVGKGRDTVKAVDVAELLKRENFCTGDIRTETNEEEIEGKKMRISSITIEIKK